MWALGSQKYLEEEKILRIESEKAEIKIIFGFLNHIVHNSHIDFKNQKSEKPQNSIRIGNPGIGIRNCKF